MITTILVPTNFSVDEAAEIRQYVYDLIDRGERHFILDFNQCTFIDSTGLGVLVSIYKKCAELSGSVKLISVVEIKVLDIFRLTRLDKVFEL